MIPAGMECRRENLCMRSAGMECRRENLCMRPAGMEYRQENLCMRPVLSCIVEGRGEWRCPKNTSSPFHNTCQGISLPSSGSSDPPEMTKSSSCAEATSYLQWRWVLASFPNSVHAVDVAWGQGVASFPRSTPQLPHTWEKVPGPQLR